MTPLRPARWLLVLAAIVAETSLGICHGEEFSPAAVLLKRYRGRCEIEIRALAVELDRMHAALAPKVLDAGRGLLDRVNVAWREGPAARQHYRGLLGATDKYDGWAREAKCPPWLTTPHKLVDDALKVKRWESCVPSCCPSPAA